MTATNNSAKRIYVPPLAMRPEPFLLLHKRRRRLGHAFTGFKNLTTGGTSIMTKRLVVFALAATTFAVMPRNLKAADALCPLGNATLSGTYMLRGGGTIVGVGPVAVVGWLTYDGKGNVVTASMTASVNGKISTFPIAGPYTVNSDCSGSVEPGQHYSFVVTPDGKEVNWIQTDPGTVSSGTEVRLGHSE